MNLNSDHGIIVINLKHNPLHEPKRLPWVFVVDFYSRTLMVSMGLCDESRLQQPG